MDRLKRRWDGKKFEDIETERKEPVRSNKLPFATPPQEVSQADIPVPQVADTGQPVVNPSATASAAGTVSPATGLTSTETALLSPSEKAIRLKQRGMA